MKQQNSATLPCAASPTRPSIARLPPSQLRPVWASFWAWRADVARLLCAPSEPGDHPAAEQHDGCTEAEWSCELDSEGFHPVPVFARARGSAFIPAVEILNFIRSTLMNEDRVIGNAKNIDSQACV